MDRQQFYLALEDYYHGIKIGNRKRSFDALINYFNPDLNAFFWAILYSFSSAKGKFPDLTGIIVAHALMSSPGFSSPENVTA